MNIPLPLIVSILGFVFFFENYVGGVKEGEIATYSDETGESIKGSGICNTC